MSGLRFSLPEHTAAKQTLGTHGMHDEHVRSIEAIEDAAAPDAVVEHHPRILPCRPSTATSQSSLASTGFSGLAL